MFTFSKFIYYIKPQIEITHVDTALEVLIVSAAEKTNKALEQVIPKALDATEIDIRLGATWVDPQIYRQLRNVAGIGQTNAEKSTDLYNKCQYLDEITDGKGTIFATGTPISNTMSGIYSG